jgi:HEAT repeat protein
MQRSKRNKAIHNGMAIDWRALAQQVGDLNPDGSEKGSGRESGRRALELIIGEENIRGAVDQWASLEPGAQTAEQALLIIGTTVAIEYCYEIYKTEPHTQRAEAAVFLLSEMADFRILRWVREFMEDSDESVRWNGLIALGRILQGPLGDEGIALAKELLARAETDHDERLRARATEIRKQLAADSTPPASGAVNQIPSE